MIKNADHLLIIYPLWHGTMPALLKAFLEQIFRPGFAGRWRKLFKGKSARIVVTMGMPAFIYRCHFGAHGLKNLKRNILRFCGVAPIKETLIGMVDERAMPNARNGWRPCLRSAGWRLESPG
jgi:putative NADPH-quinone reductase